MHSHTKLSTANGYIHLLEDKLVISSLQFPENIETTKPRDFAFLWRTVFLCAMILSAAIIIEGLWTSDYKSAGIMLVCSINFPFIWVRIRKGSFTNVIEYRQIKDITTGKSGFYQGQEVQIWFENEKGNLRRRRVAFYSGVDPAVKILKSKTPALH